MTPTDHQSAVAPTKSVERISEWKPNKKKFESKKLKQIQFNYLFKGKLAN